MKRTIAAASAALLSVALLSGVPAFAQQQLADEQLEQLSLLGIDTAEPIMVTEEQSLQLENVLNSDATEETKLMEVKKILGME